MKSSTWLDDLLDAAVDTSAATLGVMAPEFLPAIVAAGREVKKPLRQLKDDTLQHINEWAVKGVDSDANH